jgi:hypothetical protein
LNQLQILIETLDHVLQFVFNDDDDDTWRRVWPKDASTDCILLAYEESLRRKRGSIIFRAKC